MTPSDCETGSTDRLRRSCRTRRVLRLFAIGAALSLCATVSGGTTLVFSNKILPSAERLATAPATLEFSVIDKTLHVQFTSTGEVPATLRRARRAPDNLIDGDTELDLYIDGTGTAKFARVFIVSAGGGVADGTYKEGGAIDTGADFRWIVSTSLTIDGWKAELKIPVDALGLTGRGEPRVYAEYRRYTETAERFATDDPNLHGGCLLCAGAPVAELKGVTGTASSFQISPSTYTIYGRASQPGHDVSYSQRKISANALMQLGDAVELRGTYNPNFAEHEPDDPILRYGAQFPTPLVEGRQFFARSTDLLQTPGVALINTRTIVNPDAALGGEFRSDNWRGSVLATDDQAGSYAIVPGTYGSSLVVTPASKALVGRAVMSSVGGDIGLTAITRRFDGVGSNEVLAVDGTRRLGTEYTVTGLLASSISNACAGETAYISCAAYSGRAAYAAIARSTTLQGFKFALTDVSPGFRSDVGWLTQVGFRRFDASLRQEYHQLASSVDAVRLKPAASVTLDAQGRTLAETLTLATEVEGGGKYVSISAIPLSRLKLRPMDELISAPSVSVTVIFSPGPVWSRIGAKVTYGDLPDYAHQVAGKGWSSGIESDSAWGGGFSLQLSGLTYRTRGAGFSAEQYSYEDVEGLVKANWQYSTWSRVRFVTTISDSQTGQLGGGIASRQRAIAHSVLWEHAPRLGWNWMIAITTVREKFSGTRNLETLAKLGYTF